MNATTRPSRLDIHISIFYSIFPIRYVESNIRYTSAYHQYNESVPKWLHNRPGQFVTHCQKRLFLADRTTKSSITNEGHGELKARVESQSIRGGLAFSE